MSDGLTEVPYSTQVDEAQAGRACDGTAGFYNTMQTTCTKEIVLLEVEIFLIS